jgi:ferrous iron transport protein A
MMLDPDFQPMPLGAAKKGFRGVIVAVGHPVAGGLSVQDEFNEELERRLLEIGFVEGAQIEILHEGLIGGDPIAIRVDDMSVALRRHEANAILVSAPKSAAPSPFASQG